MEPTLEFIEKIRNRTIDEESKIVYRNNWFLRPDVKRIIAYEVDLANSELGAYIRIHPIQAIIITFFNGEKSFKEVLETIQDTLECNFEKSESLAYEVLNQIPEAFEVFTEDMQVREFNTDELIISAEQVDIKTAKFFNPIGMIMHIADSCVRDCLYCNVELRKTKKTNRLTTQQLLDLVDEAADFGVRIVSVAGGDPFVRKDIPEIVERIYQRGMFCFVSSKALISRETARKLKKAGLKKFQVSVDAPNSEVCDYLTNSKNSFDEAITTIKNFKEEGFDVVTNSIITPYNYDSVPELIDLLASMGVSRIALSPYAASIHAGDMRDKFFLSIKQGAKLTGVAAEFQKKYPDIIIKYDQPIDYKFMSLKARERGYKTRSGCSAGKSNFLIHEDGAMTLCEECPVIDELIVGNIKENSLEELWNSPRIQEITCPDKEKFVGTVCHTCDEFDECHNDKGRCWRESLKAFGKLYAPAPLCPKAPVGERVY